MPTRRYAVRYYDPAAGSVQQAEAGSADEAQRLYGSGRRQLLGMAPLQAAAAGSTHALDVSNWCRELRTLLQAGMTVVECIECLHEQAGGARAQVHAALLRHLHDGAPLSRAMAQTQAFPAVLVAGVAASERTSTLPAVLDDYLRYDALMQRLKRQVASAAIYPGIVISLGLLITLFLLLFVIPRFSRIYSDFHGELSTATTLLLWLSGLLREQPLIVAAVPAALLLAAVLAWRSGRLGPSLQQVGERIGPLRRRWDHFRQAKLYQSLALMFRGGTPLDEALAVCAGLGLGARMTAAIAAAQHQLLQGRAVSQAFSDAGLADTVARRLLLAGERSGQFDSVLQAIADRHAQAFATFIERATRIVEPLLLSIVALAVGGIIVMMYMPVFDIANGAR